MNKLSPRDAQLHAVELAKASEFGVTAIKVECEAQLERNESSQYEDIETCHDYLMERLSHLGLAEWRDDAWFELSHEERTTNWFPTGGLAYGEFYNDGSVDSEFTFTIKLNNPENIFLIEKVVEVWNDFMAAVSEDTGYDPELYGAGMHMAFLNTRNCTYPSRGVPVAHLRRFDNFQKSMTLLLPALYFLGSSNHTSRPLEYRAPRISLYDGEHGWDYRSERKFSAITYNQGALEFRIFNTCYDKPSVILDNFVVMANAVSKYWKQTYRPSGVEKITRRVRFGNDSGTTLERFYQTTEHVDLLNEGLKRLKPSYYTVRELKAQRSFTVNKHKINNALKYIKRDAIVQYKEYEARFAWETRVLRQRNITDYMSRIADRRSSFQGINEAEILREAELQADADLANRIKEKTPLNDFIEVQVARRSGQSSSFTLAVN